MYLSPEDVCIIGRASSAREERDVAPTSIVDRSIDRRVLVLAERSCRTEKRGSQRLLGHLVGLKLDPMVRMESSNSVSILAMAVIQ